MSWKEWNQGEVVEAGDLQEYIQDQVVQNYADSAARSTALGTAVAEGMVSYLQDSNSVQVYDGSAWVAVGSDLSAGTEGYTALSNGTAGLSYQPVSHNYIINGGFDINQRGFDSETANGNYTFDRWRTVVQGDGTVDYTAETFSSSTFADFGTEAENYISSAFSGYTSTTTALLLVTPLEDLRNFQGKTMTLSFYAKSPEALDISVATREEFGSGGSSRRDTFQEKVTLTSSWQRYTVSVAIPALGAKAYGTSGSHLQIRFWLSGGSFFNSANGSLGIQSGSIDLWGVQLEAGSIATPFKRNANSIQGELAACQRYYWRYDSSGSNFAPLAIGQAGLATNAQCILVNPVEMRAKPTITSPDITQFALTSASFGNIAVTSFALNSARQDTFRANTTINIGSSSLTAGHASHLIANNSSTAVMEFEAEL